MLIAKVQFIQKDKITGDFVPSIPYSYKLDPVLAEDCLNLGELVIVTSARSKYSLGVFAGTEETDDPAKTAIVTQEVVGSTGIREDWK